MTTLLIAMDRAASVRRFCADGRLHVASSNISKANVCPYYGREIPDNQRLGLDPDRVYRLLRHPDELAKAASTFNNLPVLREHVLVTADDHRPDLVVGATGSDARFTNGYLANSLVIWAKDSIDGVVNNYRRELSSAYRFTADMTPGNYEGSHYDGIMRNLVGNHVALVIGGRAGPDVIVGDEQMKLNSRTALMVSGAIAAHVRPLLAQDAKVDISSALKDVTAKTINPAGIAAAVVTLVTPHLAADQAIDAAALEATIGSVPVDEKDDAIPTPTPAPSPAPAPTPTPAPTPAPGGQPQPAMDEAAVKALVDQARNDALAQAAAIRTAEREVFPHVGEVVAMDSAAKVYRLALDAAKVDLTDVPEAAFGAMVRMLPKPGETATPRVALDAAATSDFKKRYPAAGTLVRSY